MGKADYFDGKAKWVKNKTPNKYGDWSLDLYFSPASLTKIKEYLSQGLKNKLRMDADGENMTFKRPTQKIIRGKTQGFAPPLLLDKDGVTPINVAIGNGSDVTIKVEVYGPTNKDGGWGVATRLEAIRVDNLVPFTGSDFNDDEKKQVAGLVDQPIPAF